jgi:protein SCO1/2
MVVPREQTGLSRDEAVALAGLTGLLAITMAWWALALWPVQAGPAWLERTRYVCFGVTDTGMPDTAGWIGLIGGPLGMLGMLLAGWSRGVRDLGRRARTSAKVAAALGLLVFGCALLVAGATVRVSQARAAVFDSVEATAFATPAAYPRLDRAAPALALVDHTGSTRTLAGQRGRPVLVTFAYAHCETVCPLVVTDVLRAQATARAGGTHAAVMIVTLDPWRDTPSRLPHIAAGWHLPDQDAWLLGGAVADVSAMLDAWEVPRSRDLNTGEVTHPSLVYVIDGEGRIAFAATGDAATLAGLLRRL